MTLRMTRYALPRKRIFQLISGLCERQAVAAADQPLVSGQTAAHFVGNPGPALRHHARNPQRNRLPNLSKPDPRGGPQDSLNGKVVQ
jgi:hypothetical protein